MIREQVRIDHCEDIKADICIVGAGVAGITLAREFINTNLKVILLESGGSGPTEEMQDLAKGRNSGLPYYDLETTRARAFGGTSHLWHIPLPNEMQSIRLRGLDAIDFENRTWIPYSGWPFEKKILDPYYKKAHQVFKIGPYRYDPEYWTSGKDSTELTFKGGNVKTTLFQFAKKEIFYNDYWKELEKADNIEVYLNSTVMNIGLNDYANQTSSVLVRSRSGKKFNVRADNFILALGGLETPRIMLLSNDIMSCGVGNQNDLVGRFFMEHPHLWSGVYYPSDPNMFKRPSLYDIHFNNDVPVMGKLVLSEELMREEKLLNFTTSLHAFPMAALDKSERSFRKIISSLKQGKTGEDFNTHLSTILKNLDVVSYAGYRKLVRGDKEKWYKNKFKYYGFKLNIMAEQIPDPESRVTLSRTSDRFGQNQIDLHWKLNRVDINSVRRSQEIIDRELRRSNLGRLDIDLKNDDSIPDNIHGGWHHMGTTRMSNNPWLGVVDENCKVHDIGNLFIAGSSTFPTTGHANPTLTITAMALRLADHLKRLSEKRRRSTKKSSLLI